MTWSILVLAFECFTLGIMTGFVAADLIFTRPAIRQWKKATQQIEDMLADYEKYLKTLTECQEKNVQ